MEDRKEHIRENVRTQIVIKLHRLFPDMADIIVDKGEKYTSSVYFTTDGIKYHIVSMNNYQFENRTPDFERMVTDVMNKIKKESYITKSRSMVRLSDSPVRLIDVAEEDFKIEPIEYSITPTKFKKEFREFEHVDIGFVIRINGNKDREIQKIKQTLRDSNTDIDTECKIDEELQIEHQENFQDSQEQLTNDFSINSIMKNLLTYCKNQSINSLSVKIELINGKYTIDFSRQSEALK